MGPRRRCVMGGARQGRREGQYAGILARLRTPHRAAQRVPATQSFIVLEALTLPARAGRRSESFLDLAGLEAARADVGARRAAFEQDPNPLEVRVEAAARCHHRVAPVVSEAGLLPTDRADLGHAAAHGSGRSARRARLVSPSVYRDAAARKCEKTSAISRALRTASAPFSTRGSACSTRSSVSTPKDTGTPVSSAASWSPLAASPAT